jgi:hypothetical protein
VVVLLLMAVAHICRRLPAVVVVVARPRPSAALAGVLHHLLLSAVVCRALLLVQPIDCHASRGAGLF